MSGNHTPPIVEDVQRLHELVTAEDVIAERLHLRPAIVRYILAHKRLPPMQTRMKWYLEDSGR